MISLLKEIFKRIKNFDWITFLPAGLLTLFGVVMIYTESLVWTKTESNLFQRQIIFVVIGLALVIIFSVLDFRVWRTYGFLIYLMALATTAGVLIWGQEIRGTRGWFYLFGLGLQPAEAMKMALVIMIALIYNRRKGREKNITTTLLVTLVTAVPVALAGAQPDFGSAAVLAGVALGFILFFGLSKKQIFWLIIFFIIAATISWNFLLYDYQKQRLEVFLKPGSDPLSQGYNVRQSIIATGSGQLFGRGLGLGTQSQLKFLPETATDFVFASIAESLGFVGAGLVIFLAALLMMRIMVIIKRARSSFGMYLVYGIGLIFLIHMTINIGMNMGMVPVTGISLPFVSYGGSFLITCLAAMGIVESVSIRSRIFDK